MMMEGQGITPAWLGVGLLAAVALAGCSSRRATEPTAAVAAPRCTADQACWPEAAAWDALAASLTGTLERPQAMLAECERDPAGAGCAAALERAKNPFALQDQAGATQSTGWLGAWTAAPSAYAVAATSAADVVAAVRFARAHRLRLVVKGTGHDYLGRSNAPGSLLVWTHAMRDIAMHDAFVGAGCPAAQATPAVSVGAGTRWLEAYREVSVKHGRYVQGGGCTSVGAAGGFSQGGGFGSWSKKFGTAAANLLEAEVVTADGRLLVANACQNQDLFWALRGGGGGTFGVVTRMTMRTHPLPTALGFVIGGVEARSDQAFRALLEHFIGFYRERLGNESWGEQIRVEGKNVLRFSMSFQGMRGSEAEEVWRPFRAWVEQRPEAYALTMNVLEAPGDKLWDADFIRRNVPSAIVQDTRPGQSGELFWWATNQGEVATYWYAYQSRWIPRALFESATAPALAATLFEASRHWPLEIHFNKGQADAAPDAVARGRETSMNPAVFDAAALLIVAATGDGLPGVRGHEPDRAEGEAEKARVAAAMAVIRAATPGAGTYVNEADYFEPDWQQSFWGASYPRLLAIKRAYDPDGLFSCHHCVGSETAAARR
jgi:FAD/FMN-containing dehydrogenase